MAYKAIVCRIKGLRKHPGADRLLLANAAGVYQIIVGPDAHEGDLGIYFPTDGQLSHEHCMATKLYRKDPSTGESMGGLFEYNRRVKTVKLRGEYSEGFWQPLSSFAWCGENKLKEGQEITSINGHEICRKYYTPATIRSMNRSNNKNKQKKPSIKFPTFKEHFDTCQLRSNLNRIPEDAIVSITSKCHGTSGRTGLHRLSYHGGNWFWKLISKFRKQKWDYVSGSRRVVLYRKFKDGYYKEADFRQKIHNHIVSIGLRRGETIYYEVVGYQDNGVPLMGTYSPTDKGMKKKYGEKIVFSYGCRSDGKGLGEQFDIYVYRITTTNEDGYETDLSWQQVQRRCGQLGLKTVPHLETIIFENKEQLVEKCVHYTSGVDVIDSSHPIEGVVVRIESKDLWDFYKWKGNEFCELEGIAKNSDKYVDLEEIS